MNKYQKALDRIKNVVVFNKNFKDYTNDLKVVQELVDKATPMKIEEPLRVEQGLCGECPHCTAFVQSRNYCGHCGQKLDWSEE